MLGQLANWLLDPAEPIAQGLRGLASDGQPIATLSDVVAGLACLAIPVVFVVTFPKRSSRALVRLFVLLATVVLLCGAQYGLAVLPATVPMQALQVIMKVGTAIACAVTAVALWWLIPEALARLTRNDLDRANEVVFRLQQAECRLVAAVAEASEVRDDLAEEMFRREVAERDVYESEARYRLVAKNSSDMIILRSTGDDGRIYVSPASSTMIGYSPEELMAGEASIEVHPEDQGRVLAEHASLTAAMPQVTSEHRIRHRQGYWVWIEAVIRLANPDTAEECVVITARDVTERRRLECEQGVYKRQLEQTNAELERLALHLEQARDQAERQSRAKSRFLAGMSHELRTPLNGILGYAQLLRLEGGLGPAQSARVDAMLGAGAHLLQMINCVLDLSEIETDRAALHTAEIDVHRVAAACIDLVLPTAEAKQFSLTLTIDPAVPQLVVTDPSRLRQVLLNLLGNAVKFTARGSVVLHVSAPAGGSRLHFDVIDTGPGIPAEQRHRLFQEFERLDLNGTGTLEGAGLGLFLSAQLAALMGGKLGYRDNISGGSIFWLELPLVTSTEALPPPAAPSTAATAMTSASTATLDMVAPVGSATPLRILVVDDVAMNRDIATAFIQAAGHQAICAEGGAEAVEAATTHEFDVILMDVRMPHIDGLEATRRIRMLEGQRGSVPIVAMTAQAFSEQVEECQSAGMDVHLAKPFTLATLLGALTQGMEAGRRTRPPSGPQGSAQSNNPDAGSEPAETASKPKAATIPALGAELSVLDLTAFGQTAAFLKPEMVKQHLRTLADKAEQLLRTLQMADALNRNQTALAEAAHSLAGSGSMFGLERLAAICRHFERAIKNDPPSVPGIAEALQSALVATLEEIERRTLVDA